MTVETNVNVEKTKILGRWTSMDTVYIIDIISLLCPFSASCMSLR